MDHYEIIGRGDNARHVLKLPEFATTMEAVKADLFKQFTQTNVAQVDDRENLHKIAYALDLFVKKLEAYVQQADYELAQAATTPDV